MTAELTPEQLLTFLTRWRRQTEKERTWFATKVVPHKAEPSIRECDLHLAYWDALIKLVKDEVLRRQEPSSANSFGTFLETVQAEDDANPYVVDPALKTDP